ncbi:hypothetical protein ASZ78_007175 [Callipepla squamata]|uniref:Sulfhydryl oxidase n=1 Tax=Callipepla squamata TaxID=9009 RepID=A0A226N1R3_CALSU|nr:hypothetical protein ASZ78_007175 [Callipepla squamata]
MWRRRARSGGGGGEGGGGGAGPRGRWWPAVLALLAAALPAARPRSLYSPDDPLELLSADTAERRLLGSPSAWAVEFFASWCGHCIHFAPTWRALAEDVREWRPAVMLAALDCADEANQQVCADFGITGFPTLKFFRAFSKKAEDGIRIAHPAATVADLRRAIITNLEQSGDAWPPACPPLEPARDSHPISQRGDRFQVALDLLQYENVAVRRVLSSEEELVEQFGVTTFPSAYLLLRNGSFSRLPVHAEARSFYTYYLRTLSGVTRGSYRLNITGSAVNESRALQPLQADRSKVYVADLESTLHYTLRVEAGRPAVLAGAQLGALKCYVATLAKVDFLGGFGLEVLMVVPTRSRPSVLQASPAAVLPTNITWVGCRGSEPHFRGYPCGLWTVFHLLTIQAAQGGPDQELPLEVLSTMRCYVKHFFGCQECAQHFEAMAAKSMDQVKGRDEAVLWLWSHHNEVNARLAGGDTEDPQFPKLQWPPPDMCPQCHREQRGVHTWDEAAVLSFLKERFSPGNLLLDHAVPIPRAGAEAAASTRLSTAGLREKEEEEERKEEEKETEKPDREGETGRPGSSELRRPSIVRRNPRLQAVGEDIVDLDSFSEQHFKSKALRAAGRHRRLSKRDTVALHHDGGWERLQAPESREEAEEGGLRRSPWLRVLGLGFSRLDVSLCIALYFLSSMCLLGMYTFFRLRTRARKGRPGFFPAA